MSDDIDMTIDRAAEIDALVDVYDGLPDGAFWAALQEHGVYPEDVEAANNLLEEQYG